MTVSLSVCLTDSTTELANGYGFVAVFVQAEPVIPRDIADRQGKMGNTPRPLRPVCRVSG